MTLREQPSVADLAALLGKPDFSAVYAEADRVRAETKGNIVQIRAILEFSNICKRSCLYCGLNCRNDSVERYRMTPEEMLESARLAAAAGYRTLVMQSGEDAWFTAARLGKIIQEISKLGLVVTVSCGEMTNEDYAHLRRCGAARYLLKHETADPALYAKLHPGATLAQRTDCLRNLKALRFETGSGFMIGLPEQTLETVAQDLLLLRELACDMAGIGPFIPHPSTPLANAATGETELTKRAVALARLLLPDCNLPATTSLGVLSVGEKNDVFSCGANVVMRKITPNQYKQKYEIYPAKLSATDVFADRAELEEQIRALDRIPV